MRTLRQCAQKKGEAWRFSFVEDYFRSFTDLALFVRFCDQIFAG